MIGRRWLTAGVLGILLAGPGCVCCGNKGYRAAREVGPHCDLPDSQRNRVYVFAVGGVAPPGVHALDALRARLNENGFAKVATGQCFHSEWMAREMRDILTHEPDAVFVLLGCESGCHTAVRLAERANADGLPVVGVVLIDPHGKTRPPAWGVRTLAVGAGYADAAGPGLTTVPAPDAGRFILPTDPRTVTAVIALLNDIAAGIPLPSIGEPAEWGYPYATPPRPVLGPGDAMAEWAFLFEQPGNVQAIVDPGRTATAVPSAAPSVPLAASPPAPGR
jgi:hypothetical protein